jgi:predicted MPP superfamily phosphohydrolase
MTGTERRWINPNKGVVKLLERHLDMIVSRFLYPHLSRVWNPYSWLLERRFVLTETSVSPAGWPRTLDPLRVLLLSDIHTGIFLKPQTLADLMLSVMERKPDLVTIAGDIVTGHSSEVRPFLDALAPLSRAPLGAWYAYGNHDYFGGDPEELRKNLGSTIDLPATGRSRRISGGVTRQIRSSPMGARSVLASHARGLGGKARG